MWSKPTKAQLSKIPNLYETEDVSTNDKTIYLHFYIFNCDWYIAEYNPDKELFFGFAILNGDIQNAEWGYISYRELQEINMRGIHVSGDKFFTPTIFSKIPKIIEYGLC